MIAEEIEVLAATPNVSVSLQIESFRGTGWVGGVVRNGVLAHYTCFLSDSKREGELMSVRWAAAFTAAPPYLFDRPAGTVQLSTVN